ncbi:TPA: cation transporter [bacterium]|nr:cation transporter [bacterium]
MYFIFLGIIFLLVLSLPFLNKKVEKNLEVFFFFMGCLSIVNITVFGGEKVLNFHSISHFLHEPVMISLACLIFGLLFYCFQEKIKSSISFFEEKIGLFFPFLLVTVLGIISSIITAIIAGLIFAEIVYGLHIKRKEKIAFCVIGCFSIGFGAALTPIGEPLSTIAIAKLKAPPYNADFLFLFNLLYPYIFPCIFLLGILGVFVYKKGRAYLEIEEKQEERKLKKVFIRAGKVYLFVMALLLLGEGFKLFVNLYIVKISPIFLYFLNISSAILDNATLTACEIGPDMEIFQIKSCLISLLVSGGMLIPGNIPNIISAERLEIGMRDWAKPGFLIGIPFLIAYFFVLFVLQ